MGTPSCIFLRTESHGEEGGLRERKSRSALAALVDVCEIVLVWMKKKPFFPTPAPKWVQGLPMRNTRVHPLRAGGVCASLCDLGSALN